MRVRVTHRELVYGTDSCGKNWPAIVDEMLIKKPTSSNLHSGRKSLKVRNVHATLHIFLLDHPLRLGHLLQTPVRHRHAQQCARTNTKRNSQITISFDWNVGFTSLHTAALYRAFILLLEFRSAL